MGQDYRDALRVIWLGQENSGLLDAIRRIEESLQPPDHLILPFEDHFHRSREIGRERIGLTSDLDRLPLDRVQ